MNNNSPMLTELDGVEQAAVLELTRRWTDGPGSLPSG